MKRKQILLIINPISGIHHSDNVEKVIYNTLDKNCFDIHIAYTQYPYHGSVLAQEAVEAGMNIVAAVGGDGTINEVASQLVGTSTALAVIPHGSGNGLAYHLHIPINVKKSLKIINDGVIQPIDTCVINGKYFFSIAGVGFDAKVAFDFNQDVKRGFQNYLKYILKNYFEYQSQEYILRIDGEEQIRDAFFITFANSSQWGYNVKIAPHASIQDGLLDVCICHRPNFIKLLNIDLPFLLSNHFDKSTLVKYVKCRELTISTRNGSPMFLHIDGDAAGEVEKAQLQIKPQSLLTVIPKII